MAPRFLTILTGCNLPKIRQSREAEPSTLNEKTIAAFTRVVERTGILNHSTSAGARSHIRRARLAMAPKYHPRPLSGGDREGSEQGACEVARDDRHIGRASAGKAARRRSADPGSRQPCVPELERKDVERRRPAQPSPTIGQAITGVFPWLEVKCSRCKTPSSVDLAAMSRPPDTTIATSVRSGFRALGAAFPAASGLMRTIALIRQERTSKIMLNGVSVARRKRLKPASVAT
jgi:hypothetical protein